MMRRRYLLATIIMLLMCGVFVSINAMKVEAASSKTLEVNWNNIARVGNQPQGSDACACYSLAYCRTMLDGKVHLWSEYDVNGGNPYNSCASWSRGEYESTPGVNSAQAAYRACYDSINNNRPAILFVTGSRSTWHYVTVIGYQNVTNANSLSASNFLIIDSCWFCSKSSAENMASAGYSAKNDGGYYYHTTNLGSVVSYDKQGPSYSDYHVGEIRSDGSGFTVMAKVTDTSGISSVKYAVWTEKGGQDDLKWYDGYCTDNNNYYWHRINFADHNNEKDKYILHMYAYDNSGNRTTVGITYDFSIKGPDCSDFHVEEFRQGAYTIMCKVTSVNKVSSVKYAVWTEKGGQDDIKWYGGNCSSDNSIYWARINFADHNNEKGKYIIHIYAYDMAGQKTNIGITYTFPEKGPDISDIEVSDISAKGYTVKCKLTGISSDVGISKVLFPTWTSYNGQDDIAANWLNDSSVKGTINNNIAIFRVNASEHNNEMGDYITDIYAYDVFGNYTTIRTPIVNVHDHVKEIIKGKNATCTENGYTDEEKCSICGKILKEKKSIDAYGHDYNSEIIEPTLEEKGYTLHTCVICGDEYRDNYVAKLTSQIESDKPEEQILVKEDTGLSKENENVESDQVQVPEKIKESQVKDNTEQYTNAEYTWSNDDEIEVEVPKFKKISNVKTRALRIRVAKVEKADGYEYIVAKVTTKTYKKFKKAIKLADDEVSFKGAKTYSSKSNEVKLSGLKKHKKYAVAVRAYRFVDGDKYYSDASSVKCIKIKR